MRIRTLEGPLKAALHMPTTRRARHKYCRHPTQPKYNVKALQDPAMRQKYVDAINKKIQEPHHKRDCTEISEHLIKSINSSAEEKLPQKSKSEKDNEI